MSNFRRVSKSELEKTLRLHRKTEYFVTFAELINVTRPYWYKESPPAKASRDQSQGRGPAGVHKRGQAGFASFLVRVELR
jgi:hypothetical protein